MNWSDAKQTLLKQLLQEKSRIGIITDMDGTISQIVQDPETAIVMPEIRNLLSDLLPHLILLAVVSGRNLKDLVNRVNLRNVTYVGSHGLESLMNGKVVSNPEALKYRPNIESAINKLREIEKNIVGTRVEDKSVTCTIHYRQTKDPDQTELLLVADIQNIANQTGLVVTRGRRVFELRPPININKGTTFAQLVRENNLDLAIYIGDDTTDGDALEAAQKLRSDGLCATIGIGVESNETPRTIIDHADLFATDVEDVEKLFAWILSTLKYKHAVNTRSEDDYMF